MRARAILGIVENPISIKDVKLYTAYRKDNVIERSATPSMLKTGVAGDNTEDIKEIMDWRNQSIKVLDSKYEHMKIQLDEVERDGQDIGVKTINL